MGLDRRRRLLLDRRRPLAARRALQHGPGRDDLRQQRLRADQEADLAHDAAPTLGFPNVSFVARTVDWNPAHLYQTLVTASKHKGTSFVHILQRCPTYTPDVFEEIRRDPERILLLTHPDGVPVDEVAARPYKNRLEHDPRDLHAARQIAGGQDRVAIGLLYRNPDAPRYDQMSAAGLGMSREQKVAAIERELDRFAI